MIKQTKTKIDYIYFVNKILKLVFKNNNDDTVFIVESNKIGKEIYTIAGYEGLYIVMNLIEQEITSCEYSNEYLYILRELEWGFNGICDEFQA